MERVHRPVLTLFVAAPLAAGADLRLDDAAAHHARVRRARAGDPVRLLDGAGAVAAGRLEAIDSRGARVSIAEVRQLPAPADLEVVVPVADRDRMLVAAEKCAELQITAWRPAWFARSRSVTTRGEGERFREKVAARMRSALEQSGGAWLPAIHGEVEAAEALRQVSPVARFLLEGDGQPLSGQRLDGSVALAVGPEGGFEPAEASLARELGWIPASLGVTTLRFETAIIAGAAVVRATQYRYGRT